MDNQKTPFVNDNDIYNKKLNPIPVPGKEIGVDVKNTLFDNIINAGAVSSIDLSAIESFTQVSQNRDTMYSMLDTMCQDSINSAVLETYSEDATEYNDQGRIIWAESSDSDVSRYVTFLLDTIGVDKHAYTWVYNLCKYGDLYLKLYRESETEDALFKDKRKEKLDEDVKLKAYTQNDKYTHYVEMVTNPAEMFELTKFGKTYGYIKAPVKNSTLKNDNLQNIYFKYKFNKSDIEIYEATEFAHACLTDNSSRTAEEVDIFIDKDADGNENKLTYTVRRGQSLFYNVFKIWRELNLLESSVLLNRITKSSIVRVINVEVGDMPKENVGPHLNGIKQLIEQKSALNEGIGLNEYTNPGPVENNVYVPTRGGMGSITTSQIGGDVDVKSLADLDYFQNKYYGAMRIPKQYFGNTDDGAGFNGGTSLSIISSRYAKMVKRIQNTLLQCLTDVINLMLLDKGLDSYVNKFDLHMLPPTTQEEIDRRDNLSSRVQLVTDVMNTLSDIEDNAAKLRILKSLLSNVITDNDVLNVIQEVIDKEEKNSEEPINNEEDSTNEEDVIFNDNDLSISDDFGLDNFNDLSSGESSNENAADKILPSPADLQLDLTDNEANI